MYNIGDLFGAITLTVIIVTLSIGLIWSLSIINRLERELKEEKEND